MSSYERRIFKIPVGNMSKEEAHEAISKLLEQQNDINTDYWFPTNENFPITEFDSEEEKYDTWTPPTLDQICDNLEKKHQFLSDGDSISIMRLVDFYRKNK